MLPRLLIPLLIVPFLIIPSCVSGYSSSDIKSWCSQTPNPQPCEYGFLSSKAVSHRPVKSKSDFLKASIELALHNSQKGEETTRSLGPKCRNSREKAAWADCLELYEYTIVRLNKTLDPYSKHTQADTETWISTALTNLETCKTGFHELRTGDYIWPLISNNNVTKLLSNCLALNYKAPPKEENNRDEFPAWVKPGDRKLLQASSSPASQANVVVAKDGSGKFTSVKDAVSAAPSSSGRYVIYVKAGVYNEQFDITKKNIMLVGDGIGKTIITGSKSVGGGTTTFRSATVAVVGDEFIARDITFRNTAGPSNHQAVALRSGSDLSVFYKCGFEGYQDTLYVHSERQFYRECDIYGTVDFIFGNAAVILQNCNIVARNPPQKTITVTAQGRTDPNQNTGIIIHNSKVTAASDLNPSSVKSYLGRPWKKYSRTVFMKASLDSFINPAGWMPWSGNFALDTLYYAEYANTGPGSSTANRVKWKGYHVLTSPSQASPFAVANFIAGNSWLPATNVPFTSGL